MMAYLKLSVIASIATVTDASCAQTTEVGCLGVNNYPGYYNDCEPFNASCVQRKCICNAGYCAAAAPENGVICKSMSTVATTTTPSVREVSTSTATTTSSSHEVSTSSATTMPSGHEVSTSTTTKAVRAFALNTDGYDFKFSLDVRFNNWYGENYPFIMHSSTGAFTFLGLGPIYGANKGRLEFYIQTYDNVGAHGRGGGDVTSSATLTEGVWYHVTVEKTADKLCMQLNTDAPACAHRTVSATQFQMKLVGDLSWDTYPYINGKNFRDEGHEVSTSTTTKAVSECVEHVPILCGAEFDVCGIRHRAKCDRSVGLCKCNPGFCAGKDSLCWKHEHIVAPTTTTTTTTEVLPCLRMTKISCSHLWNPCHVRGRATCNFSEGSCECLSRFCVKGGMCELNPSLRKSNMTEKDAAEEAEMHEVV